MYCCWCVEALGAKWDFNRFKDFKYFTSALLDGKKEFASLDKVSSEIKTYVYNYIMKKQFLNKICLISVKFLQKTEKRFINLLVNLFVIFFLALILQQKMENRFFLCCHDSLLIDTRSECDRFSCQGKHLPVFNLYHHQNNNEYFCCLN